MTAGDIWINYMPNRFTTWRKGAASGPVVLALLFVIAYVVIWIYGVPASFPVLNAVQLPIVRVVIVLAGLAGFVLIIGSLIRMTTGTIIEIALDTPMNHISGLRIVYNAPKMGIKTVVDGTGHLHIPVRIETRPGMYMAGFKAGNRASDGHDIVFIPTAPNITAGFVVELETGDVIELDESTEDALIQIISYGFGEASQPDAPNEDDRSSNISPLTITD